MTKFQTTVKPHRKAAVRFLGQVHRKLYELFLDKKDEVGLRQSDIAKELGVHRSVINREFADPKNLTIGRVAELAFVMGYRPDILFVPIEQKNGQNMPPPLIAGTSHIMLGAPMQKAQFIMSSSNSGLTVASSAQSQNSLRPTFKAA